MTSEAARKCRERAPGSSCVAAVGLVSSRAPRRGGSQKMHPTMAMTLALLLVIIPPARAVEPITIGFAEALTDGLAVVGKSGVLAAQIWADEVNAKGGLLGRPVKLVFYDHQSNAANVPSIYTKLLDVDHVDLIVSGYSTNMTAPAMPV